MSIASARRGRSAAAHRLVDRAPAHATKARIVIDWLRNEIVTGALAPGTPLRQEEIARWLDVSSTPVREAFVILEAEGFVERRPHRGVIVARPDYEAYEEIREVRGALESFAIGRICASGDQGALAPIEDAVTDGGAAVAANDLDGWRKASHAFHQAIIDGARLATLSDVTAVLVSRARRYLLFDTQTMHEAQREHLEILRALRRGDAAAALAAVGQHGRTYQQAVRDAKDRSVDSSR